MRQLIGVPLMLGILVLAAGAFLTQCACHGIYEVAGWFRETCERALERLEEVTYD